MNSPIHIKTYRMPLRSKLLDWLENNPQQMATAEQWFAMLNNLKGVKREEVERANLPRCLTKLSEKSDVPITKADEEKLHPLFVRLFDASHTLGYKGFKNTSRHIYSSLEEKFGNNLTSKFSIEHYRIAYSEFHGGIDDDDEVNYCYLSGKRINKSDLMAAIQQELEHCQPIIQSRWQFEFRPSLEMKKVVDAMPENAKSMAYQYLDHALEFYRHPSFGYWIIKTDYENSETQAPNWIVLSPYGNLVKDRSFPTPEEALDEMVWSIRVRFAGFKKEMPYTAFEEYTFPGGNDYQEWLICLPNWSLPYCDRHFRQQQLLIHIRTTERFDWDNKRILMIEEIQSPWHAYILTCGSSRDITKVEHDDLVADAPFGKE